MLSVARFGSSDLERSKIFYDEIAKIVGASRAFERPEVVAYKGDEGGMFLIGKPFEGEPTPGNGTQVGFAAPSRAAVDAAHAKALELGGTCEGPAGFRGPEEQGFYATYFRDPDRNKIMVMHFGAPSAA